MTDRDTALDLLGVYRLLRKRCAAAGGQKTWAEANGVSEQTVSAVLNGRRAPSALILEPLGLRIVTRYAPIVASPPRRRGQTAAAGAE